MMATDVEAACLRILDGIEGRADHAGRTGWHGLNWLAEQFVGGAAAECEHREHGGDRLEGDGGDGDAALAVAAQGRERPEVAALTRDAAPQEADANAASDLSRTGRPRRQIFRRERQFEPVPEAGWLWAVWSDVDWLDAVWS